MGDGTHFLSVILMTINITFNNGGNKGNGLKNVTCKQTLTDLSSLSAVKFMLYVHLSSCKEL